MELSLLNNIVFNVFITRQILCTMSIFEEVRKYTPDKCQTHKPVHIKHQDCYEARVLAFRSFLWGDAARRAHAQGLLTKPSGSGAPHENLALRSELLGDAGGLDPRRCALAVVLYPEGRTLAADEADTGAVVVNSGGGRPEGGGGGGRDEEGGERTVSLAFHAAGYDPAWLVPFTVLVMRLPTEINA